MQNTVLYSVTTVSYTHLDVYKRQVLLSTEHYSGEIDEEADKKTP